MVLDNKNAIVYGAGGSMGGAVAKALAGAGARVVLTGRHLSPVQKVADQILAAGGSAVVNQVNAMDEKAINNHMDKVAQEMGTIDMSFNGMGHDIVQNIGLVDMSADDFMHPISYILKTQFLTATAAGKAMMKQGSGVILTLTATPGGISYPFTGGFGPACSALESFSAALASELGMYGIRVVNIRSGGSVDSTVFRRAIEGNPERMEPVIRKMEEDTMLKKLPLMTDIGNVAVFLSSDMASKITGVTIDVTCGTTAGLNYRTGPAGSFRVVG